MADVAQVAPDPVRYPVTGRAPIVACPVHGLAVALDDAGRIKSRCPACLAEASQGARAVVSGHVARATKAAGPPSGR